MKSLWFENRFGDEKLIAQVNSWKDVFECINAFIDQCNENRPEDKKFKSYYTRTWEENGRTKIDVGSWNEFFYTDLEEVE